MKKALFATTIIAIIFTACNQTGKTIQLNPNEEKTTVFESKPLIEGYLTIEKSLVIEDSKTAAEAAKTLVESLNSYDEKSHTAKQINVFRKIKTNAIKNAEQISVNADKIDLQRKHFKILSEDFYDYVKVEDLPAPIYKINCPMYKDGSFWLSKTKEIKNPYFGDKMLKCGDLQETIK
jgi:hypothetical protein